VVLRDPGALRAIGYAFGTSQLVLGTDYPFDIQELDPVGAPQVSQARFPPLHSSAETSNCRLSGRRQSRALLDDRL